MNGRRPLISVLVVAIVSAAATARAQPPAGSDWSRVEAIQAGTMVRISSQRRPTICSFVKADADSLTCMKKQTVFFVPVTRRLFYNRQEVTLIKLSRQFLSGLAGAGIGAGAGAGIGAGLEAQYPSKEDGHLLTVVFAFLGGGLGAGIGAGTDFLAGPTVYRAP
jgi:hypothetical protein